MNISKEDTFCWEKALTKDGNATATSDVLDFGKHGDDILHRLFLVVYSAAAAAGSTASLAIAWETCAAENFAANVTSHTITSTALAAAALAKGAYPVKNVPIPHGLKRYNRLKFTNGANAWTTGSAPVVSAFVVDGRTEPL